MTKRPASSTARTPGSVVYVTAHGVALFDGESRLIWGSQAGDFRLGPGMYGLVHALPSLPLRPGPYFWRVSLYDDEGLVDVYDGIPPLSIATEPMTHSRDDWAGILNFQTEFRLVPDRRQRKLGA